MEVKVSESDLGRYAQEITAGEHTLTADESVEDGGNDLGPSPYDFLLAALGSCTSITLRMYSERKQIPLKKAIVRLSYEKVYAEDCADCESTNSKMDHIDRQIELHGDLTEDQRKELLEIANKCPVHRSLTSEILITTQLVED